MKKFLIISVAVIALGVFNLPSKARAATDICFCYPSYTAMQDDARNLANKTGATPAVEASCVPIGNNAVCDAKTLYGPADAPKYTCEARDTLDKCQASVVAWQQTLSQNIKKFSITGIVVPSCLLDPVLGKDCRNIDTFVQLLINFAGWSFTIIGALALAVFIYGGFVLILSQGNSEKIQTGMGALTAAVIGLFIAFMGYLLIKFVGDSLGIKALYQLK